MAQQGGGGGTWTQTDSMIAGGIAAFAGASVVFWLAGQIGAVLFGHPWPAMTFNQIIGVLFGVLANPLHPSHAWPGPLQSSIPPAPIYYLIFVLMVGGGIFGGLKFWNFVSDRTGRNGLGTDKSTWASRGSLKTLSVSGPEKGRLVLGHAQGKLVAAEPRQSCIVMGPSQSGKTTGLAIPAILEWEGPVIATSVKTDLARDSLEWRKKLGRVWVYDPTVSTSLPGSTWSPLDGAKTWGGAKKIANWLVGAGQGEKSGLNDAQFWYTAAGKLLAPHLYAAAANGYTMADVVRWIDTQEDFELRALLQATGCEEAIQAAEASWQREERARSSIYTTAEVVIEAYSDPTVLESAKTSAIQPDSFFDGGMHTLYVCAPGHEQNRLRPVFSTMLKQFITAAYEKCSAQGGEPLDPPLLIVLDEAANIAPLTDLDAIASTAAGHGIQLLTVWQDLSQIKARYADRAQTVVNNHRAKIVLSGISDTESLDYTSRLIGSEEVKQTSYTTDAEGRKQKTESKGDKNLAPSDVLRRIKPNEGVLVYGALLPSRLILRPWYKNRVLRARAHGESSASSAFPHNGFHDVAAMANEIGGMPNSDAASPTGATAPRADYPLSGSSDTRALPSSDASPYGPTDFPRQTEVRRPVPPNSNGAGSSDAAGGANPAIEDLFDFSDFDDWDDEDDEVTDGSDTNYGSASSSSQPAEGSDRFAAAMDEWLKMFPASQRGESTPGNEPGQPSEPPAGVLVPPAPEDLPSGYDRPNSFPEAEISSHEDVSAIPETSPTRRFADDYEDYLAWKKSRSATEQNQTPNAPTSPTDETDESSAPQMQPAKKDEVASAPLYGSIAPPATPKNNGAENNGANNNGSSPDENADEDGTAHTDADASDEGDSDENSDVHTSRRGRYYMNGNPLGGSVPPAVKPTKPE